MIICRLEICIWWLCLSMIDKSVFFEILVLVHGQSGYNLYSIWLMSMSWTMMIFIEIIKRSTTFPCRRFFISTFWMNMLRRKNLSIFLHNVIGRSALVDEERTEKVLWCEYLWMLVGLYRGGCHWWLSTVLTLVCLVDFLRRYFLLDLEDDDIDNKRTRWVQFVYEIVKAKRERKKSFCLLMFKKKTV